MTAQSPSRAAASAAVADVAPALAVDAGGLKLAVASRQERSANAPRVQDRAFDSALADAFAAPHRDRPLLLAVPLYRHPEFAQRVVASLIACAEDLRRVDAEVVLYNDSPEHEGLAVALAALLPQAQASLRCRLEVNDANLGFLKTANRALQEATERGMDALLLNSDTVLFPGALPEMVRVSRLDPMVGFVNPRSNNATLASLPSQRRFRTLAPAPAEAAWAALAPRLPPVSYTPTAVGFCLLIRWQVLAEFGLFDEIYGRGYNEENDLIMRAGRRGYRAVLANHAFVWHEGGGSFELGEATNALDLANRKILLERYPEYGRLIPAYFDSPAQQAEHLLGALVPEAGGRLRVALDFSHFVPAHNGTFIAGRQLLEAAVEGWSDRYEVGVLCSEETYLFHDLAATGAARHDPHGGEVFAAIFRVGQPYDHNSLERMVMKAPVMGFFMLDTISIDCAQLADPQVANIWSYALEHADLIATTSDMTADQLERRFVIGPGVLRVRSLHSLDLDDYRLAAAAAPGFALQPGYTFVIGNHYAHKDVVNTANALSAAYPERTLVVLMGEPTQADATPADAGRYAPGGLARAANIRSLPAGKLSDAEIGWLYANAEVIVFPSHYEGFGMPLLNALAARRPVFVRPLPVFAELCEALGEDANVHVYPHTGELVAQLASPPAWSEAKTARRLHGDAARAALDISRALDQAIRLADYGRIVRRLQVVHFAHDLAGGIASSAAAQAAREAARETAASLAPKTPRAFVARAVGRAAERVAGAVLAIPGVFPAMHAAVQLVRLTTFRRSAAT